ncbi:MAG TPA: hypothetical protein PKW35_10380 [Nannocystaceae bacterium]|nr:hypothetical protein [Nannocystaceae bacterium]
MFVHCSNPTCSKVLTNSVGEPIEVPGVVTMEVLRAFGWRTEAQPDGSRLPICGRCAV